MGKALILNDDPFCDVDLMPLPDLPGKSVVRLRHHETQEMTPINTIGAIHGENYSLVTNAKLHQMTQDILERSGMDYSPLGSGWGESAQSPFSWDGQKFASRWVMESTITDFHGNGDSTQIMLGLEAINSYAGSMKVGIRFFAMSMRCRNQFYSANLLGGFTFRHQDNGGTLDQDLEDAMTMLQLSTDRFADVIPRLHDLRTTPIGRGGNDLEGFLDIHRRLGKAWTPSYTPALLDELSHNGPTRRAFGEDDHHQTAHCRNMWGLLNAYTAVCTHKVGGFRGAELNRVVTDQLVSMT